MFLLDGGTGSGLSASSESSEASNLRAGIFRVAFWGFCVTFNVARYGLEVMTLAFVDLRPLVDTFRSILGITRGSGKVTKQ